MPALSDSAFAPFTPSQLVTLSPLQDLAAYRIVPAVADRVSTNGRRSGSRSTSASCEDFAINSVCNARPHKPMDEFSLHVDDFVWATASPFTTHCQSSSGMVYSLLSFQIQSILSLLRNHSHKHCTEHAKSCPWEDSANPLSPASQVVASPLSDLLSSNHSAMTPSRQSSSTYPLGQSNLSQHWAAPSSPRTGNVKVQFSPFSASHPSSAVRSSSQSSILRRMVESFSSATTLSPFIPASHP
jgi:hypothetical protein